jgi:hypothetical protein
LITLSSRMIGPTPAALKQPHSISDPPPPMSVG